MTSDKQPPPSRKSQAPSLPRLVAARVLLSLRLSTTYDASELLEAQMHTTPLDPRDARLATALVMTALRRSAWLDLQFEDLLSQPIDQLDDRALVILRLAAAQHTLMDRVPPHAITDDSVRLAQALGMDHYQSGFINAVVRRLTQRSEPNQGPADAPDWRCIELSCSLPQWISRMMLERFTTEDAHALSQALAQEPTLTLRANRLRNTPEELAETLAGMDIPTEPGLLSPDALRVTRSGALAELLASPAFAEGRFYIQDEASQAVAMVVAPRSGERILDYCAAPGGKATHLAELGRGEAHITAAEISSERTKFLKDNIDRLGSPAIEISTPAGAIAMAGEGYDAVLIDAPCSALGTLRRHPEVARRLSRAGLRAAGTLQRVIIDSVASVVRPGGRLIYSTCSFTHLENRDLISDFLKANPDFHHAPAEAWPEAFQHLRDDGDGHLRTWPTMPAVDGFEVAMLVRDK
ncbi:hypothetical protein CVU37_01800 [candidate division BRC1 bacterium HGW-BRC1-1]|nr:MAG: hypothetical protein CVU37_01800 [candidate division BRC1 bacterium HGW-BRC1-1]